MQWCLGTALSILLLRAHHVFQHTAAHPHMHVCMHTCSHSHPTHTPTHMPTHTCTQHSYYAGFFNDTALNQTYFTTVLSPSIFLNCTTEGARTGCLYQYDQPDAQCVDNRRGFMCGQCPPGQGVDLTLRKCKECTAGDAVGLVIICEYSL